MSTCSVCGGSYRDYDDKDLDRHRKTKMHQEASAGKRGKIRPRRPPSNSRRNRGYGKFL